MLRLINDESGYTLEFVFDTVTMSFLFQKMPVKKILQQMTIDGFDGQLVGYVSSIFFTVENDFVVFQTDNEFFEMGVIDIFLLIDTLME